MPIALSPGRGRFDKAASKGIATLPLPNTNNHFPFVVVGDEVAADAAMEVLTEQTASSGARVLHVPSAAVLHLLADERILRLRDGTKVGYEQLLLVPQHEPVPHPRDSSRMQKEAASMIQGYRSEGERGQLQQYLEAVSDIYDSSKNNKSSITPPTHITVIGGGWAAVSLALVLALLPVPGGKPRGDDMEGMKMLRVTLVCPGPVPLHRLLPRFLCKRVGKRLKALGIYRCLADMI